MENDLEEGEVVSDTEEDVANKTAAPETAGVSNPSVSFSWRADQPFAGFQASTVVAPKIPPRQPIQRLQNDSCESGSSDDDVSDSDSDGAPFAKKKCTIARSAAPVCMQPTAARQTSKYNIWGSVLQEQTLSKDLGGWFGMKTKVKSDRDVETYDYRNARLDSGDSNVAVASESVSDIADVLPETEETPANGEDFDICDRETFGTVSTGKNQDKISDENPEKVCDADRSLDEIISRKRKWGGTAGDGGVRQPAKSRLSKRTYDGSKDRSHIRVSVDESATAVAEELVRVLGEPEHMKETFMRVAETLGAEKALEILYCTEDLEDAGGLMTLDGSRRRTPGGVYLFLIKDDRSITRDQQDVIFYGSTEERRRHQREMKRRRWQHHRSNIVTMATEPCSDPPALPSRKELFLLDAGLPNGSGDGRPSSPSVEMCGGGDAEKIPDAAAAAEFDDEDGAPSIEIDLV